VKKTDFLPPKGAPRYSLLGGAAVVYACLFYNRFIYLPHHPKALLLLDSWPVILFLIGFAALTFGFYAAELANWVLLIIFFVPLEISSPFSLFPSFSPIDYFCASALLAMTIKCNLKTIWKNVIDSFGWPSFLLWSAFLAWGLADAAYQHGNPRSPLRWGEFLFIYFLAFRAQLAQGDSFSRRLSYLLAGLGAVLGAVGLAQSMLSFGDYTAVTGTFEQHNVLGAFLSLCAFPAIRLIAQSPSSKVPRVVNGLIMIGLIATFSRGAWLGFSTGVVYLLWFYRKQTVVRWQSVRRRSYTSMALYIIVGLLLFVMIKSPSHLLGSSGRIFYWRAAERIFHQHPWVGLGPGNYDSKIKSFLSGQGLHFYTDDQFYNHENEFWMHLHNLYLQIAVDYGGVGFTLWLLALLSMIRRAARKSAVGEGNFFYPFFMAASIAFLIHNLVDILTVASFDLIFAGFMAAMAATSF